MDDALLELATKAARRAGDLLIERFREPARGIESKSTPTDLVSDADRDAEAIIVETIRGERPDDGILGEEGGREVSGSGLRWVIDPLDGTVNFLFRIPVWCVSIAVEGEDRTRVAVVYDPCRDELFSAMKGFGAWLNGRPTQVTGASDLADALIGTGFAYDAAAREIQARRLPRVLPRVRDIRRAGSAALDLASVACGRLDGFFEAPMNPWDKAAGVLLVEEAGGLVAELSAPLDDAHGVIAAGPQLFESLRELVLR